MAEYESKLVSLKRGAVNRYGSFELSGRNFDSKILPISRLITIQIPNPQITYSMYKATATEVADAFLSGQDFTSRKLFIIKGESTEQDNSLLSGRDNLIGGFNLRRSAVQDSANPQINGLIKLRKSKGPESSFNEGFTVALAWAYKEKFKETFYVQAPERSFNEEFYAIKNTPELINITINYDAPIKWEKFKETFYAHKSSVVNINEEFITVVSVKFNEIIYAQLTNKFNENFFVWKNEGEKFNEVFEITGSNKNEFNEVLEVTYTNGPQQLSFNEELYLIKNTPELIYLVINFETRGTIFREKFNVLKTNISNFNEIFNVMSKTSFNEVFEVVNWTGQNDYNEEFVLIKTSVKKFRETFHVSKIGGIGVGGSIQRFNETFVVSKTGFNEIFYIFKGDVSQVGDVVREQRGRATGLIVSGVDFVS